MDLVVITELENSTAIDIAHAGDKSLQRIADAVDHRLHALAHVHDQHSACRHLEEFTDFGEQRVAHLLI